MEISVNKETVAIELPKKKAVLLLASLGTISGVTQHKILQNYSEELPKFITLEDKTEWLNEGLELKELQNFLHDISESLLVNINDSEEKTTMKLKINDSYYLETDALNYTLKEERVSQQGKVYTNTIGHYGSLEGLLKELVKHKIRVSEFSDAYKLKQLTDEIMKEIEEFCSLYINNTKGECS